MEERRWITVTGQARDSSTSCQLHATAEKLKNMQCLWKASCQLQTNPRTVPETNETKQGAGGLNCCWSEKIKWGGREEGGSLRIIRSNSAGIQTVVKGR